MFDFWICKGSLKGQFSVRREVDCHAKVCMKNKSYQIIFEIFGADEMTNARSKTKF